MRGWAYHQPGARARMRAHRGQKKQSGLKAGELNPDHAHDWDARVLVIGGEITLTRAGKKPSVPAAVALSPPGKCTPNRSARKVWHTSRDGEPPRLAKLVETSGG